MGSRRQKIARALAYVRDNGRVKLARLAWEMGWSYKYARYAVLPEMLAISVCLRYDKSTDELVWDCGGEEDG